MFVPNSSPAKTVKEFIEHAKAQPGKLIIASPGTGAQHFSFQVRTAASRPRCRAICTRAFATHAGALVPDNVFSGVL